MSGKKVILGLLGWWMLCISAGVYSQSGNLSKADSLFGKGEYEQARVIYESWLSTNPTDAPVLMKNARCCREIKDFAAAAKWFKRLSELPDAPVSSLRFLGESMVHIGEYEEARYWLNQYSRRDHQDEWLRVWLSVIDTLDQVVGNNTGYDLLLLTVNTPGDETSCYWQANSLLYSSSVHPSEKNSASRHFDLFQAEGSIKGMRAVYFKPSGITPVAGDKQRLTAMPSPDGTRILYAESPGSTAPFPFGENKNCNIWLASIDKNNLSNPLNITTSLPAACHISPCWSHDGRAIYFSSNMPGGMGGFDIWYMRQDENGNWSQAFNLGGEINTPGDEVFPHLHPSGEFYFASNGQNHGVGGFDIFASRTDARRKFGEVRSLPYPINSEYNELFFTTLPDGVSGIFSSDRPDGAGGYDLYLFRRQLMELTCREPLPSNLCGTLSDVNDTMPGNGNFIYSWDLGNGIRKEGESVEHCFIRPGKHRVFLSLLDPATRGLYSLSTKVIELPGITQAVIQAPETGKVGETIKFSAAPSYLENHDIVSWKWELGDGNWLSGEVVNHVYHRPGVYKIRLSIAGINENLSDVGKACTEKLIIVK